MVWYPESVAFLLEVLLGSKLVDALFLLMVAPPVFQEIGLIALAVNEEKKDDLVTEVLIES